MKKNTLLRKALVMICTMALVACLSVAATIAYFTDSDSVTNTFTVGNVEITMDEANTDKKDAEGKDNAAMVRDTANKYHLVPGMTYEKDPTIHVAEDSEDCWLFVKVENGIADIETTDTTKTIAAQMTANGWTLVDGTTNIYAYKAVAKASQNVPVFANFTIDGAGVDNALIETYKNAAVNVTAYAVQAAGFETSSAAAWADYATQNPDY